MKVLNFGSLNLDYVYQVDHFVQPGETLHAISQVVNCGGKGLNQSIALAKAGANVYHAGCVGVGGERLIQKLEANHVDVTYIDHVEELQGNAIIQVDKSGENSILLFGGSNQVIGPEQIAKVLADFGEGDYIILQNETSCLKEMIAYATQKKMKIVLNPSPFEESLRDLDYGAVSWLLVNEIEAAQISGEAQPEAAWRVMHGKFPSLNMVITMGSAGSVCYMPDEVFVQPAYKVEAVDTTAAGDTFTGYFLASIMLGKPIQVCMERATKASAISVQRRGAADSIPSAEEVDGNLRRGEEEMNMDNIKISAYETDAPSLCEAYEDYFKVGAAIHSKFLKEGTPENALIKKQFNIFTLNLESKPLFIHPEEDRYVFAPVDEFVEFGEQKGAVLRGHTLVWHESCPDWFFYDKDGNQVSEEVLLKRMKEHIKTVVSRYRGRIHTWDVVNEVIHKDGDKMRETMWYKIAGTKYIKEAFRAAHEADPDARLIINDYNLEDIEKKTDKMIEIVRELHEEGVPVHGVGLQMHLFLFDTDIEVLKKNVRKLLVLRDIIPDFKLEVTELDVSCYRWGDKAEDVEWTDELRTLFRTKYTEVFRFLMELSKEGVLDSVVFWGIHDGDSWLNDFPVRHKNYPLLIDRDLLLKPAFFDVVALTKNS